MIFFRLIRFILRQLLNLSMIKLPQGSHITRYYMYEKLSSLPIALKENCKVLSVSHSKKLYEIMSLQKFKIIEANYPHYNILALDFPDNEFDYFVCDQVLEHVEGDPQQAVNEAYRVLRPGGIAIFTTCFLNPIHNDPGDYWRFSPDALKLLFERFSKIIEVDGWGNPYGVVLLALGLRFIKVPHSRWHPIHKIATVNNKLWPISTWIVAMK